MNPVDFPEKTVNVAESQDEYLTLPAIQTETETISKWRMSWWERLLCLLTGTVWLRQCNFGRSVQPVALQVLKPFETKR